LTDPTWQSSCRRP